MNETKQEKNKKNGKLKYVFLFLIGILLTTGGIYLYKENQMKSNSYISIAADLYSTEKIYKAGKPYYEARYSYKVNDKEYKYDYPRATETVPQNVIVLKYNKENPTDLYNNDIDKYCLIVIIVGIAISILSIIVIIAKSTQIPDKNVITVVEDLVTCVGGSRIYLSDVSIPITDNRAPREKYYVLFSNNLIKYAPGNQISFNAHKYKEFLPTEQYKENIQAQSLYDYKEEDLVLVNKKTNGQIQ